MIAIENLAFSYGRRPVLDRLSLAVREGEYLAVVGPNGAGKSTLLKLLVRALEGGTGTVTVAGRPLSSYRQRELARIAAYVPQGADRPSPLTLRQFVLTGRYPYSGPRPFTAVDRDAVERAIGRVGMADFADRPLSEMSGGERQMAFLAGALAQETPLLLLDEPASALDPTHREKLHRVLTQVHAAGTTILLVTHDLNAAALAAGRMVALRDGKVAAEGTPAEVMTQERLGPVYGHRFVFVPHPVNGTPMVLPGGRP